MKTEWNFTTCYIISPENFKIDKLRSILEKLNLKILNYDEFKRESSSVLKKIEKNIRRADFILTIFSGFESPNYYFEMGLAYGLKKPFFSIIDENVFNVPSYITNHIYSKVNLKEIEKIQFSLTQFLSNYKKRYYNFDRLNLINDKKTDFSMNSLIKKLNSIKTNGNGLKFEKYIRTVLNNFNDIKYVKKQEKRESYGVDFSIWINGLDIISANPVLIETKFGNLTKSTLLDASNQLRKYLIELKTSIGIIIYFDLEEKDFDVKNLDEIVAPLLSYNYPLVIFFEVNHLLDILKNQSLTKEIIKIRNKKMHRQQGDLHFG